jgi:iron complex outermembrane receptor protein
MQPLKRNLLSMALASATLMLAGGAYAQSADQAQDQAPEEAQDLDAIQVVGIRRSIEDAIDTKQNTTAIVESISAEDIGKLPDSSIADSIARLPGLTAQRFGNRPQEINIRGFAGDFSTALLNGREQVSLGNNRGVEFDQYPSEFASQVIVNKATQADLVGQGLSGTVNIKTIRPLAYGKQAFAVNVRADQNRLGSDKENGYRASVSYVDQFADNTVGIALGYARLNNPGQGHQYESWGFNGSGLLDGGKFYDFNQENERDGFAGTLEFKPNDMYSTVLDVFYSKFDKVETKRGLEFGIGADWSGATLVSRTNNASGTATSASFTNIPRPVVRNDYNAALDDLFSLGWTHTLRLNDNWTFTADLSGSEAVRDERILETYAGAPAATPRDRLSYTLNPDGYFDVGFGLDYGNPANLVLTDPGGWGQDAYIKDFRVKDSLSAVRFDLERTFDSGFISNVKFGLNYTDRTKSRSSNESFLDLAGGATETAIPRQYINGSSGFDFGNTPSILSLDALAMFNGGVYVRRPQVNNGDINNKNWEVDEQVTTLYVQAGIDTEIGSIPVRGNVGFQAVNADQSSTGVATFENVTLSAPSTRGASVTDFLPSLNLSFQLPWEQFVRVAASRQMARPRMDDLRANAGFGIDRTRRVWTGGGGNPELEPTVANSYDVSYEKYFEGNRGYVGVAYFYKDLRTYIYNDITEFDFSQLPVPPGVLPIDIPPSPLGQFNQPVNGKGGTVKGWELTASIPFGIFWEPLEGFGIQANYSDTRSSIKPRGPAFPDEPIPGLSKYITNATVYYERFGFSARVAQRRRSDFIGEVQGFGGDRTRIEFNAETVTDVQLGYTIQDGPLKNLAFLLQVNNLENEPFTSSFDGRSDRPRQFFEYGRTYLFGINWRY